MPVGRITEENPCVFESSKKCTTMSLVARFVMNLDRYLVFYLMQESSGRIKAWCWITIL